MKLVATFHQPSSVIESLKCRLTNSPVEHLVIAKLHRLDVFTLEPEGLRHQCSLDVWGRIIALRAIPAKSQQSNLLLMTDHPDPELIFLKYETSDTEPRRLVRIKQLSLYERSPRPAEFYNNALVDPNGQLVVVSCYAGKLKFILLKNGNYHSDLDLSIPEIHLLSLAFLYTGEAKILAILHLDSKERVQLHARDILDDVETSQVELSQVSSVVLLPTVTPRQFALPDACPSLIAVPPSLGAETTFPGGVLVVGGRRIFLYEVAPQYSQDRHRGKQERLRLKRKSLDKDQADEAREKEREREGRSRNPNASIVWPWSRVMAWCQVDEISNKFVIGDAYGRLALVSLASYETNGLVLVPLGEASPPTCLTYLTNQVMYLGSHFGDSQLLRVESMAVSFQEFPTLPISPDIQVIRESDMFSSTKGKGREISDTNAKGGSLLALQGKHLTVLETFKNIAPIRDAITVDPDGSKQPCIVTCSGGGNTGSVNVIRKGADFEEFAVIDGLVDIIDIWPIRALFEDETDAHILVSTLQESHFLRLDDQNTITFVEPSSTGFVTNQRTLAATNIPRRLSKQGQGVSTYANSSLVVQVTATAVTVLEFDMALDTYTRVGQQWTASSMAAQDPSWNGREIVVASVNPSQFTLGLSGSRIALLNLGDEDHIQFVASHDFRKDEISAISCVPLDPSQKWTTLVVVAFWTSNHIEILSLASRDAFLTPLCRTSSLPALPRSVLLYNFGIDHHAGAPDYRPCLLTALTDGSLVYFTMRDNALTDQKVISLGDAPVNLAPCVIEQKKAVFACGSRAAALFWDKERLHNSPVLLKDAITASRINTHKFPSSLILAASSGLIIGKVRDVDKMHIRSIPFGLDIPERISHHPEFKVFAVACLRTEPVRIGDGDVLTSSLQLLDDTNFRHLTKFSIDADHHVAALEILTLSCGSTSASYFCAGTFKQKLEEECSEGRLLLFNTHRADSPTSTVTSVQLTPIASLDVRGWVQALASIDGMIAAAIGASVVIFALDREEVDCVSTWKLRKVTEWNYNYCVCCLVSRGNNLILGDRLSSVSVLTLEGTRLRTVARDYGPLSPVSIQTLDDNTIIGANADYTLFTFSLQSAGNKMTLERSGSYCFDDIINKFIPGGLTSPDAAGGFELTPKQLLFTVTGGIGIVVDVGAELSLQLTALQRNMTSAIPGIGGLNHTRYRAPRKQKRDADSSSFGFLDGDFLEQLLNQPPETLRLIQEGQSEAEKLTVPLYQLQRVLEVLQGMH